MKSKAKLAIMASSYLLFSPLGLSDAPPAVAPSTSPAESQAVAEAPTEGSEVVTAETQGVTAETQGVTADSDSVQGEPETVLEEYKVVVSEGERIEIDNGQFSIETPTGWNIHLGHPSLSLLMQAQKEEGMKYQRTIQIASFADPKYIDDVTKQYFEELIVRKFSQASASVEDFRIRNSMVIQMDDGRDGLLFYSEFLLEGVPLMQAHILVSSPDRHFLMTFTDLAEHFEGDQATEYLNTAWASMTSIQLNGPTPVRYSEIKNVGMGAAGLVFLILGVSIYSRKRAGKKYENFEKGVNVDDDEDELQESELQTINQEMVLASKHVEELDDMDDTDDTDDTDEDHAVAEEEALEKSNPISEFDDDEFDDIAV